MYPSKEARELAILLRISRELDIVGDVTATVESPSELLAWTLILHKPQVLAWRATHSGHRYIQVTAQRSKAPIRGHITAILHCERHPEFWEALSLASLNPGDRRELAPGTLSEGWAIMPLTPESSGQEAPPQPPQP
ncbi:hypothetical protein [Propioniciclava sinopodophylli]|uniref:hypothetical protein n=1 Tax=Propioniciclava sinopodophylli TaxID=1837344 RepID=UPI00248FA142|nr:hypothetical protein [Propioniciclava sinopodophylli]